MIARVLLLAGGLRPSPLASACGDSVLALPVGTEGSLLAHWAAVLREVLVRDDAEARVRICVRPDQIEGLRTLMVSLIGSPLATAATSASNTAAAVSATPSMTDSSVMFATTPAFELFPDQAAYRGPAGVVRDATRDLPKDANVLIVEASRLALTPIRPLIEAHCAAGSDVTVGINPDASPAGLFVIRVEALDLVSDVGFVDLKEQFLPKLVAAGKDVRVFALAPPAMGAFRTRGEFLAAVLASEQATADHPVARAAAPGPVALAPDAFVDPTAYVAHSVIGPEARIESGAVVVRTIVMARAVVPAGASISDAVVTLAGVVHDLGSNGGSGGRSGGWAEGSSGKGQQGAGIFVGRAQ
jgi:hypothetical protein